MLPNLILSAEFRLVVKHLSAAVLEEKCYVIVFQSKNIY